MIPAILAALGEAAGGLGGAASAGTAMGMSGLGGIGNIAGQGQQFAKLGGGIQSATGAVTGLINPLKNFDAAAHKLYGTVNLLPSKILEVEHMIVSTAHNWVAALASPIDTVRQLGDAVGRFVQLANPGALVRFNFHMDRASATLGNILTPIMESLTRTAEKVGDTFARLKPALDPAIRAVVSVIDSMTDSFATFAEFAAPLIQATSYHLLVFVKVMDAMNRPAMFLVKAFNELYRGLGRLVGLNFGFDAKAKADAAVKEPSYASAEDLQRRMAKDALQASFGKGPKNEEVPSLLKELVGYVKDRLSNDIGVAVARAMREGANNAAANTPPGLIVEGGRAGADFVSEANRQRDLENRIAQQRASKQGG